MADIDVDALIQRADTYLMGDPARESWGAQIVADLADALEELRRERDALWEDAMGDDL